MADAKQEMSSTPSQSRVVLAKPRLGGFGASSFGSSAASKSSNPFGSSSVLRPPQLKPVLSNPFLRVSTGSTETDVKTPEKAEVPTTSTEVRPNDTEEAPKFVPLASSLTATRATSQATSAASVPSNSTPSSGFVFGQNLSDRAVVKEALNNGDSSSVDHSSSNGTSELLFTSAVAATADHKQEDSRAEGSGSSNDGLAAAAAEYERARAKPPPPSEAHTATGEEDETNVLQVSCKLFAWEAGGWRERGRGSLRLNDGADGSRLVARVAGSLRVMLNTKLWGDMVAERASSNSLRITAADAQAHVKVFLIMSAPADIAQLQRALQSRIATCKKTVTADSTDRLEADPNLLNEHQASCFGDTSNLDDSEDIVDNDMNTSEEDADHRLEVDSTDQGQTIDSESLVQDDNKPIKRKESEATSETPPKRIRSDE